MNTKKDMKLILLQHYYENKTLPTVDELIGDCDRHFPYWTVTKTEARNWLTELSKTHSGPGPRTVSSPVGGGNKSVKPAVDRATRRYLGWLFNG